MCIIVIYQSTCILSYHLPDPHHILCQQDRAAIKGHFTFSGTWASMAHYEEQNMKVLYWEIPGSGSINKSPFSNLLTSVLSQAEAEGSCQPGHRPSLHRRNSLEGREWHISCLYFVQQSRYFVCTYCSEFVSLSHLYLHCLFSEACYYFYWAIFSRTGRARSDSLTWTLLPSSLHKTDWIWMRSLVLMSIIFISQDIFFRTLPAINYVVYLFFSSTML